jgi:orotate phosphoribosyltransferase
MDHFRTPGAFRTSRHASRMGLKRPFYMDFDHLVHDPVQCEEIVRLIAERIQEIHSSHPVHAVGFIEKAEGGTTGALTIAGAVSIFTRLPNLVVRLWKDIPSERIKLPPVRGQRSSERLAGMNVVVVTDHSTTGDEVLRAARAVEYFGAKVEDVIIYTSIESERKKDAFGRMNVHLVHLLPQEAIAAGLEVH